jgi:hypothetical protein
VKKEQQRPRGLPAIRENRARRLQGRLPPVPARVWLWLLTGLVAWGIFYWRKTQAEVESRKAALFARQRGVLVELRPRIDPVLKRIESWTVDAGGPYAGDFTDPALPAWDFAGVAGIYLRERLSEAKNVEAVRKAADASLRDGFTACLFHEPNPDPTSGSSCRSTRDCASGTFCNELDHCTAAAQPYNMRAAYRGSRVLTDEWTVGLRTASDDMRMRLLEREYDVAIKDDIPLVIDLLTRAQFYLLVLDEEPEDGSRGKAVKSGYEEIQAAAHPARVFLFGLKGQMENRPLLRLRMTVDARIVPAGESASNDPKIIASQQRQANSCQLALGVRAALSRQ